MYLGEAGLFLTMLLGLWRACAWLARGRLAVAFPSVTAADLQRWAFWQVVFVACWSVVFKLSLPLFMRTTSGPLWNGDSQWFALAAEGFGGLLAVWGLARSLFGGRLAAKVRERG